MANPEDLDKITLKWLYNHVPVPLWFKAGAIAMAIFTLGFGLGANEPIAIFLRTFSDATELERQLKDANTTIANDVEVKKQLSNRIKSLVDNHSSLTDKVAELDLDLSASKNLNSENEDRITELAAKLGKSQKEVERLSERTKPLATENKLLRIEIDNLKNQLPKLNKPPTKNSGASTLVRNSRKTAFDMLGALYKMDSKEVGPLLIDFIPTLEGGVECSVFAYMVKNVWVDHQLEIVAKGAPYVQRPFDRGCLEVLADALGKDNAAAGVSVLVKSKSTYSK